MSNSSKGIPYVPENTLDPAAGLNDALKVIDALVQPIILGITDTPPISPEEGDCYIVDAGASDEWIGKETQIAYWAGVWQFLIPKTGWLVYLDSAGSYYRFAEGSPGDWSPWTPTLLPVVTEASASLDATAGNAGGYTRFTNSGAKSYTFDDAAGYVIGSEYSARNVGVGDLTLVAAGAMTLNPPAGGSLVVPQGGSVTVKIVASDEADVMGVTVGV